MIVLFTIAIMCAPLIIGPLFAALPRKKEASREEMGARIRDCMVTIPSWPAEAATKYYSATAKRIK